MHMLVSLDKKSEPDMSFKNSRPLNQHMYLHVNHGLCACSCYTAKETDNYVTGPLRALLVNRDIPSPLHFSCKSVGFGCCIVLGEQNTTLAGGGQVREMMAQVNLLLGWWWVLMLLFCSLQ